MSLIDQANQASKIGDLDSLRSLLKDGFDPNQHASDGWTPLTLAAVRGQAPAVELLLEHSADPGLSHKVSGGRPIHFAGHSGSVGVAKAILARAPSELEQVWLVNGHTLLLQAAFYGHLDLTRYALEVGGNTAATTVRGLAAREFAQQFQNKPLEEIIIPYDKPKEAKKAYFDALLAKIAVPPPAGEEEAQGLADELSELLSRGLADVLKDTSVIEKTLKRAKELIDQGAEVNRLAGPLGQPALIVLVTGTNGSPISDDLKEYRFRLSNLILEHGGDPTLLERHPMAVHAIIRAAVFNHLDIIKKMGEVLTPSALAQALNDVPFVNGLTALHDTVLRGSMVGPDRVSGYLDQMRWFVEHGARSDMEDFSGRTQAQIAHATPNPETRALILEALGLS
jgi:hypothetical protein